MAKKIHILSILWLVAGMSMTGGAQNIRKHIALEWNNRSVTEMESEQERIYFTGATYNTEYGNFPLYRELFSEETPGKTGTITIENPVFIPAHLAYLLSEEDKNRLSDTLVYTAVSMPELRRSNMIFTMTPFRKNNETGAIEQLYCADLIINFTDSESHPKSQGSLKSADGIFEFPEQSPLATGTWYKVKVDKSGVFKITGADLKSMGMDISSINPKNLKVYGMEGGMLPEINPATPNIGIQEQAIYVYGEEDGAMSETDYILFYGSSPNSWSYDDKTAVFKHAYNIYDNYNYYFISATSSQGKRIQSINNNSLTETATTNQVDYRMFHEQDLKNVILAGKNWVGETFSSSKREYAFTINVPNPVLSENFLLSTATVTYSPSKNSSFTYYADDTEILKITRDNKPDPVYFAENSYFTAPSGNFSLKISFSPGVSSAEGYLDYFEIQARRNLVYNGAQMDFRDKKSFGDGKLTKFIIQNASQATIWDVTDFYNVQKMVLTTGGNNQSFKAKTDILREFIAFDVNNCETPAFVGKVDNQNLAGQRNLQSVIITHPDFFTEAGKIEEEHRNNLKLKTLLVTTDMVFNEYSSGRQDIGAIRDFMRMLYYSSDSKEPFNLLLVGDASCDYKNVAKQTNFLSTWGSMNFSSGGFVKYEWSHISDDFYALLDENEGGNSDSFTGIPDIAVGRFPVKTNAEMQAVVAKRLNYTSKIPETFGSWRNVITFISDDPDATASSDWYSLSCEAHERLIMSLYPKAMIKKIYADSYQKVASSGGTRYPGANKALTEQVDQGTLILNYVGHGSKMRWSNEVLLDMDGLNAWKNYNRMPFVITETCSFAPFDDIEDPTTAGEYMFLMPNGGAIGMIVSSRVTYNTPNNILTNALYGAMLPSQNNNYQASSIGFATLEAKRKHFDTALGYVVFGDPALTLSFPKYDVVCTEINEQDPTIVIDTLSALTSASFKGEIRNLDGSLRSDFNGIVYPTVFDKEMKIKTLGQVHEETIFEYKIWKNIIFKGSTEVRNGKFVLDFFVPKDIDYTPDFSKVSFYASDGTVKTDANGVFSNFVVGGFNADAGIDQTPPQIRLFMNDTLFVSGGYTNQNPVLLALLYDESGINATGTSVGHDITIVLDGNTNNEVILNNYYESDAGNFKKGRVTFPMYNLSEGEHTITLRAWDSYNNSAKETIKFVVVSSNKFIVSNFYNYPNPFSTTTNFVFEHNASNETLDIDIRIFDLTGRMVSEIRRSVYATGYRISPIQWNGDTGGGALLSGGYYVYQAIIKSSTGGTVKKSGKLIISR